MGEEEKTPKKLSVKKKDSQKDEGSTSEKKTDSSEQGTRTLYRSRTNKMIGGVCGGLGEYFSMDPTLVRVLFVIAALFDGLGLLAYIVGWIVIPEGDSEKSIVTSGGAGPIVGIIIGAFLVFAGLRLFADNFHFYRWMPWWINALFSFQSMVAIILICAGAFVVFSMLRKKDEEPAGFSSTSTKEKSKASATQSQSFSKGTLYRSRTNKQISGVCGGLGEYLNIDPTIVRVLWVVISLFSLLFPGIIVYFIMAAVIPETPIIPEDVA